MADYTVRIIQRSNGVSTEVEITNFTGPDNGPSKDEYDIMDEIVAECVEMFNDLPGYAQKMERDEETGKFEKPKREYTEQQKRIMRRKYAQKAGRSQS